MYEVSCSQSKTVLSCSCLVLAMAVFSGCSTTHYRESADKEVYGILEAKSGGVPGLVSDFDIEQAETTSLDGLPTSNEHHDFLGGEADSEIGAAVISLESALDIAFTQSREYQSRKEQLYLRALTLTLDRHQFSPTFSAGGRVDSVWSSRDGVAGLRSAVDDMTGASGAMLQKYANVIEGSGAMTKGVAGATTIDREQSIEGSGSVGMNVLFKGGSRLALDLTTNFVEFLKGGGLDSAFSNLSATFVQPLLRGRGRDVFAEFLTQSEREVLYELRDFTRFRKTFAVRVASEYYQVLLDKEIASNNFAALKSNEVSLERERAFQAEGLTPAKEVARLEQSKLSNDSQWISSVFRYKRSLDSFKVLLGLPADAHLILDSTELQELMEAGIESLQLTDEEAVELALVTRLDLYTVGDEVFDAERRIKVAANDLKADVDLILTGGVGTKSGNRFASFDFERSIWTAGVAFDLPLDRKGERNNYVRSLIDYASAGRSADLATDNVKLDVRNAYRQLQQSETNYQISLVGVEINERRVDEVELLAELGLGDVQDVVDAQDDLTQQKTALVSALVNHRVALLGFWRDIGILYVKPNGQWEEMTNV